MMLLEIWLPGLAVLLLFGVAGWLVSLGRHDVSIVDSMWSLLFLLAAYTYAWNSEIGPRGVLVLVLVLIWSLGLAGYITWRNWDAGEDFRYQQIRRNNEPHFAWKSLYIVFGLQAVLAWFISLPLLAAMAGSQSLGALDAAAFLLWATGLFFEAVGDLQLTRFRADPANRGKVLQTGLWRLTRHPNYFGDFCIWWGFFLFALPAGGWWSLPGPLLMTFLLLRVSGVAMLERDIGERRPEYAAYIARTNAFFPGRPKSESAS